MQSDNAETRLETDSGILHFKSRRCTIRTAFTMTQCRPFSEMWIQSKAFAKFRTGEQNIRVKGCNEHVRGLRARGIMVDMEEGVINQSKRKITGKLFDQHQFITSVSGSGNNWAYGHNVYGVEYQEQIMDSIRKEAEFCDSLQCFMTIQSSGGGTGSGLGSRICTLLEDEYPSVYRFSAAVVPSPTDDVVTSPYNTILSLWKLTEHSDCVIPLDNQALHSIVKKVTQYKESGLKGRRLGSALTDNGNQSRQVAFDAMNNIVANLILNMTR